MNPQQYTVAQVYARLDTMIRQRKDTGFRLAMSNAMLGPANPFEPGRKRRPKATVISAVAVVAVLALIFAYFSFRTGR